MHFIMNFFHRILSHMKQLKFFHRLQTSSEIAQKSLEQWVDPVVALDQLLKRNTQTPLTFEAACIIWGEISMNKKHEYIPLLGVLLQQIPRQMRERALRLATRNDTGQTAFLLRYFAPLRLEGFTWLAATIKQVWDQQQRNDEQALAFYSVLAGYGLHPYAVTSSIVRVLHAMKDYHEEERVLLDLFKKHRLPPSHFYLTFLSLRKFVERSPKEQIEALSDFIKNYASDPSVGPALLELGNLYSQEEMDYQKALDAYCNAEKKGLSVPPLQAYRLGNWDMIPALRTHPDYLFPLIVVLDLEVDPHPSAPKGSRVFEIAAVRYKGQTCLETYQSYIHRNFHPSKWDQETAIARLHNAPTFDAVVLKIRHFIRDAFVIGHNLCSFDAPELEGMGIAIAKERMIDTFLLARLLHPDSLHHHLTLLCQRYSIHVDQSSVHTALSDAQCCALLFHALGDSITKKKPDFVLGFRALVRPGSAFDRTLLQPRGLPADPTLGWEFDPSFTQPSIITALRGNQESPSMHAVFLSEGDYLVEHTDFDGRYHQLLSPHKRSLVAVGSRTRIEHLLTDHSHLQQIFVIPSQQSLLCPLRLRQLIETMTDEDQKLLLFCLYQASHNHDADTLYPLRLPSNELDDSALLLLKQTLLSACCSSEPGHSENCPAQHALREALATQPLLLSTHKNFLKLRCIQLSDVDTIVIDDFTDLQMHLAEYSSSSLDSRQINLLLRSSEDRQWYTLLEEHIREFATAYAPEPGYRERLPLSSFSVFLERCVPNGLSLLDTMKNASELGAQIANTFQEFLTKATQRPTFAEHFHAYWIDLWFAQDEYGRPHVRQWAMCGLSEDLRDIFQQHCWNPYKKHVLAGPALALKGQNTEFLHHFLNLPSSLPLRKDPRPKKRVYLPTSDIVPPAGLLQRRKWIMQVGVLLAYLVREPQRKLLVTLNNKTAVDAFLQAFLKWKYPGNRQILAPQFKWTITKINERLHDPTRRLLVFASPQLRQTALDSAVDVEVSGPLRFLNRRDPLVVAQMHVFAHMYPKEGPFQTYLLPQALLELKARLSSDAKEHIICDGSLLSKSYRDEVLDLLQEDAEIQKITDMSRLVPDQFLEILGNEVGGNQETVSDTDLAFVLRSVWDTDTFRPFAPFEETSKPTVTQKDIVRAVLEKKDQLVIAATGGGKSLCFQLPAIILAEETIPKVTLIFSPLIALMTNQVEQLNRKGIMSAIMLNSTLSVEQRQEHLEGLKKGVYSILYLAPEQIYSSKLEAALRNREIGLVAIDEAHCLSQWGHNFRTDYFMLRKWIKKALCNYQKREFPILAVTATARKGYRDSQNDERSDQASTVEDIIEKLDLTLDEEGIVMSSTIRPELAFHFEYVMPMYDCPRCKQTFEYQQEEGRCPTCEFHPKMRRSEYQQLVTDLKRQKLLELLSPDAGKKTAHLPDLSPRWSQPLGTRQRGLIYCAYKKTTEEVAAFLQAALPGLRISAYHAGMGTAERNDLLRKFTSDEEEGLDIIASTNAFGMGIDVRRLGFVIHYDTPATPEAYYQEAGRAGRDKSFKEGKECAQCILFFHPSDLEKQRFLSSRNSISDYEIEDVYKAICEIYERENEQQLLSTHYKSDQPPQLFKANDTFHVFSSAQEIALRAGVEEDQVTTLLYYLEEHTTDAIEHKKVLERGMLMSNIWRLKFGKDSQDELNQLPHSSPSWSVVDLLQNSDDYRLQKDQVITISARELADRLSVPFHHLETELLNLVKRRILISGGSGQFQLNYPVEELHTRLMDLEKELEKLFLAMDEIFRGALNRRELVTVNIRTLLDQHAMKRVTFPQLIKFLFRFSLDSSEPMRLLEHFKPVIRNGQPDMHELQLCLPTEQRNTVEVLHAIFKQLDQTVTLLASRIEDLTNYGDWYAIDLFDPEFYTDIGKQSATHQQLLILEILGLLHYRSDPAIGQTMQIILLQPPVPLKSLSIDLRSLRLQEKHADRKRKLMEQYVTLPQKDQYAQQFALYFQGAHPLIEQSPQNLRQDLSHQQRQIVLLKDGIHVIVGPPGCGKTTTLTEHIQYLVTLQVPIDHILVTTYYRAAEGHIAETLKRQEGEGITTVSTTINAFGGKIFRQYLHLLLKPNGTPYYESSSPPLLLLGANEREVELAVMNQVLERVTTLSFKELIDHQGWIWPQGVVLPLLRSEVYRSNAVEEDRLLKVIHRLRQYGVFPTHPPSGNTLTQMIGELAGIYSVAELYAIYTLFLLIMAEQNHYTYDDQIVFALALLRTNPDLARVYQRYFEHIIIDELQDFSPASLDLLSLLYERHGNVMAFGDPFQDIRFDRSGEDVKVSAKTVFSKLAEQESCGRYHIHQLTLNFRSTQEILDLCSYLGSDLKSNTPVHLQSAINKHGPKPVYLSTESNTMTTLLDATLHQIEHLSGSAKESIALILGTKDTSHGVQTVLQQRRIPFSLMDGQKEVYQLHYMKNVLLYFYLILDKSRDEATERLLRYNIVPYFDTPQIQSIKDSAKKAGISLFETLCSPLFLKQVNMSKLQQESLQWHLKIINDHQPLDLVKQLEQDLNALHDGPLSLLLDQEEKIKQVKDILSDFHHKSIESALDEIQQHITYLDEHRRSNLVLTTIDHAKSQEFETVFLLGIDKIFGRRLYVGASRAKQQLFFVGDITAFTKNRTLSQTPKQLYDAVDARDSSLP